MAGGALAPIQTSTGSAGRSARLASATRNRPEELTVSPASRRLTISRASSKADGRVMRESSNVRPACAAKQRAVDCTRSCHWLVMERGRNCADSAAAARRSVARRQALYRRRRQMHLGHVDRQVERKASRQSPQILVQQPRRGDHQWRPQGLLSFEAVAAVLYRAFGTILIFLVSRARVCARETKKTQRSLSAARSTISVCANRCAGSLSSALPVSTNRSSPARRRVSSLLSIALDRTTA